MSQNKPLLPRGTKNENRTWTTTRLKNLISTAYFDLFNIKDYRPTDKEVENWLLKYFARETFKARQKKEINNKNK